MLDVIAKLVDFDPDIFDEHAIVEDFTHKFANSWVNIDGQFRKVISLYQDDDDDYVLKVRDLHQDNRYIKLKTIHKITKHMPETGLYKSKYGLLYLTRIPARQWLKSYAEGKNYKIIVLEVGNEGVPPDTRNTVLDPDSQFHRETMMDHKDQVWLHWKRVGKLNRRTYQIHLDAETFFKEIKELWPQYQITLDVEPQPARRDDALITDF